MRGPTGNGERDMLTTLWRNQFVIGRQLPDLSYLGFTSTPIGAWTLWSSPQLKVSHAGAVTVLGLAAAVSSPSIAEHYADISSESDYRDVVDLTLDLAGRFVAFASLTSGPFLIPDGIGSRQVFLSADGTVASSSEVLLKKIGAAAIKRTAVDQNLLNNPEIAKREYATFGLYSPTSGFGRLLPNRVANLGTGKVLLCSPATVKRATSVPETARELRKNLAAIASLGPLRLGLTAGFDSRLILAAADAAGVELETFTFTNGGVSKETDAAVASRVARALDYRHVVVQEPEPDPRILELLEQTQIVARPLPNVLSQLTWLSRWDETRITVSGLGGEISRSYYGLVPPRVGRAATRRTILGRVPDPHDFVAFDDWWQDRFQPGYPDCHVPATTLHYWEQRVGIWGAFFLSEKDLFADELSALASGRLQQRLLSFSQYYRTTLRSQLFSDLIEELSPRIARLEKPKHAPLPQRAYYATPVARIARTLRPGWGK